MGEPLDFDDIVDVRPGEKGRVLVAALRGYGAAGAQQDAAFSNGCEVVQPLGLLARPVIEDGLEGAVERVGNTDIVTHMQNKKRPVITDLDPGETRLEGAKVFDAKVRIMPDGSVLLVSIAGKDVVLNGGTLRVARDTDPVNATAPFAAWTSQVTAFINAVAPGTIAPPAPTQIGVIAGGASRVKA